MKRILFLCMGNICRSPAAHCVFQQLVTEAGLDGQIEIDSAGTIGYHAGSPPDARMRAVLEERGYRVFGQSRPLGVQDLEDYDLILAMDEDNLADARRLDPEGRYHAKIRLFTSFCQGFDETAVPDPYYGGERGFHHVLDMIEDGCGHLLEQLRGA